MCRLRISLLLSSCLLLLSATAANAAGPRVLPEGKRPNDKRLGDLKTLNGYFPFSPCKTPEEWARRSERVRRQMLVANGLWPMPRKTPANAVIHGKIDRGDYTVEKVYLESYPGHFVTGNLYRPKGKSGAGPGVLCPHGHWANGRFHDAGEKKVKQEIEKGAEKYEAGGRSPLQARCVQLARMGCTVFHYDMVGYADSVQLKHRPGIREAMNTPENWGLFSPQAEARLQNFMGLQTYNSIRTLDWFSDLPEVDPERVAVTGASGGGTQTFILCAVDTRPAVAFPAVMVSTAMQGGCTCENAPYLRVDTGNIEIAALISPRPLGMTAADDWTKEIATKGLPELKQHYKMLGCEDLVMAKPFRHFGHNYNYVSRAVMYDWLNKHLKLGLKEIVEEDYKPLSIEEMSVWDDEHPKPPGGDEYERALLKWMTEDAEKQIAALKPKDAKGLERYREIIGGAVDVMIGRGLPEPGAIEVAEEKETDDGDYRTITCLLRSPAQGEELPVVRLMPKSWKKRTVVWIDKTGKQALFDGQGKPKPGIRKLLDAGIEVVGVDLFGQGEFTADGKPLTKARMNKRDKQGRPGCAGYTFGYNHPVFSKRVHDILSVVSFVKNRKEEAQRVDVIGLGGAGHWVAAARAQAGAAIDRAVIDTAGFRFAKLTATDDPDFLPGGAKYGDLPGIIALSAPHPIWLTGEGPKPPPVVAAAYKAAGKADNVTAFDGKEQQKETSAVKWLRR